MGKGNKRLLQAETSTPKVNYSDALKRVQETEDIDELIELSRCESDYVRLKTV